MSATEGDNGTVRRWSFWLSLALVALFTLANVIGVMAFVRSGVWSKTFFTAGATSEHRIDVTATITEIDPVRGTVNLQLNFFPRGDLRQGPGTLASPVVLHADEENGTQAVTYRAGDVMTNEDFTLSSIGDTANYPFDDHHVSMELVFTTPAGKPVPSRVTMVAGLHDWKVRFTERPEQPPGEVSIEANIERSLPVIALALCIMIVEVVMVLVQVVVVTRAVTLKQVRFTTLAALAALLFAVPAVRGSMPNTPPVGTLSDFLVFFWAITLTGGCLVTAAISWFRQAPGRVEP